MRKISLIIYTIFLFNCATPMKKFDWLPGACAPKNYPIEIYKGAFVYEDDNHIYIPSRYQTDNGWATTGPTHVVGPDLKPAPVGLELYWMSFAEKKWYKGSWQLPQDKIIALFEEGYTDTRIHKKKTFGTIVAGMAPGGVVVVWMKGGVHTREVARFQAEEAEWPAMADITPGNPTLSREDYLKLDEHIEDYLNNNEIPYGLWDTYRTRYQWHPKIILNNSINTDISKLELAFYNGEWFGYVNNQWEEKSVPNRAVPRTIIPTWEDETMEYFSIIKLNEAQIFKSFKEFFNETNKEAYLQVTINNDEVIEVCLTNGEKKAILQPEKIERYKNPKDK